MAKSYISKITFFLFFTFLSNYIFCQYPSGFAEDDISNWNSPISMQFDHNGTMFVAERAGKIYKYQNSQKTLLLDITEEVATYGDFGLLGLALDPDFAFNGFIYLYYIVDRHHLLNFGTPSYNASSSEQGATIARLTRYTVSTANNFNSVVPNSRQILLGETKSAGVPLTGIFHAGGDMAFSVDGTLLVSTGDGASGADYESQALADQIITTEEYTNRRLWRCQMNNSLNGKILRIDPATGNGVPSNPFFDSNNARSAASRVWAKGFRNPFRFTIKPNTGDHNSSLGQPGVIVVGDVGQETNEEINFVTAAGQNFGWPKYEGISYVYASNPSFEPVSQKMPTVEWNHNIDIAKVVINNTVQNVGSPAFPFSNFKGGCVILGPMYEGSSYPTAYQNKFFLHPTIMVTGLKLLALKVIPITPIA